MFGSRSHLHVNCRTWAPGTMRPPTKGQRNLAGQRRAHLFVRQISTIKLTSFVGCRSRPTFSQTDGKPNGTERFKRLTSYTEYVTSVDQNLGLLNNVRYWHSLLYFYFIFLFISSFQEPPLTFALTRQIRSIRLGLECVPLLLCFRKIY